MAQVIFKSVEEILKKIPRLIIQRSKTGQYLYEKDNIYSIDNLTQPTKFDYLGFSFDGHSTKIREKSLFKYYSRAYKKVRFCNDLSARYHRKAYRRALYKKYTHLGKYSSSISRSSKSKKNHYGNFITYAERASKEFDRRTPTLKNFIKKQIKRHWNNIHNRLDN